MSLFSKLSLSMRFKHNIQMFDTVQQLLRDNCRQLAFLLLKTNSAHQMVHVPVNIMHLLSLQRIIFTAVRTRMF